jgi:hypothetical protein
LNAWNTTDNTTGSGLYTRYGHAFSPADHALANLEGWTITVRARMIDDFGGVLSCFFDVANDNDQRFLVSFDLDGSDNLTVELGGLEVITIPSNGTGWANYHTHELVYDPVGGTADYYFDGNKLNSAPWSPTSITGLSGVRFGNGSSGGRGSMNWNKVEFRTAQTGEVLALYDAGNLANTPVSLDPLDQDWVYVTSTGTSAGPVLADSHSIWEARARFFPTLLPDQIGSPSGFGTAARTGADAAGQSARSRAAPPSAAWRGWRVATGRHASRRSGRESPRPRSR